MGRSSLNMSLYAENPPKIEPTKSTYFRQRQPEIRLRSQAKFDVGITEFDVTD